jgi:hypothetical protein
MELIAKNPKSDIENTISDGVGHILHNFPSDNEPILFYPIIGVMAQTDISSLNIMINRVWNLLVFKAYIISCGYMKELEESSKCFAKT